MKGLGATFLDLALRTKTARALAAAASLPPFRPTRPEGLQELTGFGANPGNLNAWVFVPEALRPGAALIVALHGCGQGVEEFAKGSRWAEAAVECNALVLFPEQKPDNNRRMCFNWFLPRDVARTGGELASILQMIDHLRRRHQLANDRIFVTGLSAGGAMAVALLARAPGLFAGAGVIAGLPFGAARNAVEALAAMAEGARSYASLSLASMQRPGRGPRILLIQGAQDRVVNPANAELLARQWAEAEGLAAGETAATPRGRVTTWRSLDGPPRLRLVRLEGFEHGAPIDARSGQTASAHMIDFGWDSTREIAEFWGLGRRPPLARAADAIGPSPP